MSQQPDGQKKGQDGKAKSLEEVFVLERSFPSLDAIFSPLRPVHVTAASTLVALDTNILLLPYQVMKQDLAAIAKVLNGLAAEERIFVPARAIREFARLRETKFAEMVSRLNAVKSRYNDIDPVPNLFKSVPGFEELEGQHRDARQSRKLYLETLGKMVETVKSWRQDDPVTKLYRSVFLKERIIDSEEADEAKILESWRLRVKTRTPPGYKDAPKDDEGIGDYLIWLSLLHLGKQHKKDLLFVTGDGKPDWAVRDDKKVLYTRPELISEYAEASDGAVLRVCNMEDFLREMDVDPAIVADVAHAESVNLGEIAEVHNVTAGALSVDSSHQSLTEIPISFDYSKNDGLFVVGEGVMQFVLRFSKASDTSIYLYKDGTNLQRIARLKGVGPDKIVDMRTHDSSSRSYTIMIGEYFYAENTHGNQLIGKVTGISDDTRGATQDNLTALCTLYGSNVTLLTL